MSRDGGTGCCSSRCPTQAGQEPDPLRPAAGRGHADDELARLIDHGAKPSTTCAGRRTGWVVLADPEGNEFCILRSAAEVAATA
jgi:hypothetical protein